MDYYLIGLFLHVVGALGFFAALALESVSLQQLQRSTTAEQVTERLRGSMGMRALGGISMATLLVSGFYMTATVWGGVAWISVALVTMIVLGVVGGVLTGPRMAAIRRAVATESGSISADLDRVLHHPLLAISIQTRIGMALGIVFLMTVKPALIGALLAVGIATLLGLVWGLATMSRKRTQEVAA